MTIRKISAVLIATVLLFSASLAHADVKGSTKLMLKIAAASTTDEVYTLTVPDDFTITSKGWNEIGSIKATYTGEKSGGFTPNKKVVVTVTSVNNFELTAEGIDDTIRYFVTTSENGTNTTEFEFRSSEITKEGTSKTIGVNVGDYSTMQAGDYEDTLEYNAAIQDVNETTVTWTASDITHDNIWMDPDTEKETMTKDGVTLAAGMINANHKSIEEGGTFTTASGKFIKIEITADDVYNISGDGWSGSPEAKTWTGSAASVSFNGDIMDNGQGTLTIVFTIEE